MKHQGKTMFRISILTMTMLFFISMAAADETAGDSSGPASERIRANERAMVRAGVPRKDAAHLTRLMMENRFREQHTVRVQNLVIETVEKDLPYKPVMNKAFEGIAKNIAQPLHTTNVNHSTRNSCSPDSVRVSFIVDISMIERIEVELAVHPHKLFLERVAQYRIIRR